MLPLADYNPRRIIPWFTYLLIGLNFVMFFFEMTQGEAFVITWSFVPQRFLADPLGQLPTLFTSMFMHAGWLHILGNMLYLWVFGDNIEDRFGHVFFIFFYIICGLTATFTHMLFNAGSVIPTLGASGAVAGVLGAYLVLYPVARVIVLMGFIIIPLPAIIVLGFWFVIQVFYGVGSLGSTAEAEIAYMAHIGGFVTGFVIAIIFRIGKKGKQAVY